MLDTRNLTILFTDIVGYTERAATQSRAEHAALLAQHDRLLQPLIRRFAGTLIKSMGDGMLITFASSTMAVRCAMAMQDALTAFNADRAEAEQLHIRAALSSGDVQLQNNDVFGEAVTVAARIEAITPPGQIWMAASVYLAMNKAEVSSEPVGSETLKGIPAPVVIYRVLPQGEGGLFAADGHADAGDDNRSAWQVWLTGPWGAALGLAALSLLLAGGWYAYTHGRAPGFQETSVVTEPRPPEPAPAPGLMAIEAQLAEGDVAAAQQSLGEALAADEASAELLLAQGHLAFANTRRETGVDMYRRALELDPALAANPRLASNLVSALGWDSQPARELLARYRSPAMVDALAARTGQPGYWGRWHAAATLRKIGKADRIRRFDQALLDLQEAEDCDKRRDAVARLGALNDRRALPVLTPLAEMPLITRLTSPDACLVETAQAAIKQID